VLGIKNVIERLLGTNNAKRIVRNLQDAKQSDMMQLVDSATFWHGESLTTKFLTMTNGTSQSLTSSDRRQNAILLAVL